MSKDQEIKELVKRTSAWTTWPSNSQQPTASTFYPDPADFRAIRHYSQAAKPGAKVIRVRHRDCQGEIVFSLNEQDPIMSEYSCLGYSSNGYHCNYDWPLVDILKMSSDMMSNFFYVELVENKDDLLEWPQKLADGQAAKLRFTTLRPLTRDELITSRVKRLFDIRARY